MNNIILKTDSYKITHWKQYPPNTTRIYSYLESRGGEFDETVFFGLQYILKKHLVGQVLLDEHIGQAKLLLQNHFGQNFLNENGWERILKVHQGRLPLIIKAVPEGTVHGVRNVLMTIENTDPELFWLTNFVETLLMQVWYPCTVATLSREIKKVIKANLEATGDPTTIDFKLHDFGFRGVSSTETAGIGGAAHLVNFKGTDTLEALNVVGKYYDPLNYYRGNVQGHSIPASEHSTITTWGKDSECEAHRNMLDQYPDSPVASVSDSWDILNCCSEIWGSKLKEKVLSRNGTVIIRPDSGEPVSTVLNVLTTLGRKFGTEINKKGYRVLPPQVRIIQGDGIDLPMVRNILGNMRLAGWSGDNIAFGSGGGLLQKMNRDTSKYAIKCSWAEIDGMPTDVFKISGQADKASKKGRFDDLNLPTVFENGELVRQYGWDEIRENAKC